MQAAGEIHCYLCGESSGTWEWPASASPERGAFRPLAGERTAVPGRLRDLRCPRCGGPVYLEEIAPVRARDPYALDRQPPPHLARVPRHQRLAG